MLYGIISAAVVLIGSLAFGFIAKINLKDQIALSCLLVGGAFGVSTGFIVSEAIGMLALSIVFLLLAFLFGYERG